jgi:hypothetical protein
MMRRLRDLILFIFYQNDYDVNARYYIFLSCLTKLKCSMALLLLELYIVVFLSFIGFKLNVFYPENQ